MVREELQDKQEKKAKEKNNKINKNKVMIICLLSIACYDLRARWVWYITNLFVDMKLCMPACHL